MVHWLCPLLFLGSFCLTGMSRQTPCPSTAHRYCPHGLETFRPPLPGGEDRSCPEECQMVPYLGWLLLLPCKAGFPGGPFCLCLFVSLPVQGAQALLLLPLRRQLPRFLEGHRNATAHSINLSSQQGFLQLLLHSCTPSAASLSAGFHS